MTTRSIYAWLVRRHPRAFRERFERDMLWVFDETVAARGGIALIFDAMLSLARQWILRPRRSTRLDRPAPESGSLAAPFQRTGWYRGLTPEIHLLILYTPLWGLWSLLSNNASIETIKPMLYAGIALFVFAFYGAYKRRLLRAPLRAPASLAHLPYRLQLEDSLKTIGFPLSGPATTRRQLFRWILIVVCLALWNVVTVKLGYIRLSFTAVQFGFGILWGYLASKLNAYAAQTLRREIERLPSEGAPHKA